MINRDRYEKDKASVISMVKVILITLIAGVLIYFFSKFAIIMVPFLVGFILAKTSYVIARPIVRFLQRKRTIKSIPPPKKKKTVKEKRSLIAQIIKPDSDAEPKPLQIKVMIVIYIILLIIVLLLCVWCVFALIAQASNAITVLTGYTEGIDIEKLKQTLSLDILDKSNGGFLETEMVNIIKEHIVNAASNAVKAIPSILTSVVSAIWKFIGSLPEVLFSIICVILSGYYFISDGPEVMKVYLKNVPNRSFRKKSVNLINELFTTLFRVLGGYIILLLLTSAEAYIVLEIAGVQYAIIIALVTGLIDFLPVLGISATLIPVIVYCFLHGNYTGVIAIIIGMVIMTVVRRILEPIVLGKTMKLHPLLMLTGMVIGVYVWGPIGFLLGPTVMIIVIQTIKVFEVDKKILAFMSRVLSKFMADPENEKEVSSGKDE